MTVRILVGEGPLIDALGRRYISRKRDRACVQCGGAIRRRGATVKYCSRDCFYESRLGSFPNRTSPQRRSTSFVCGTCGKTGSIKPSAVRVTGNFCSRPCAAVHIVEKTARRGAAGPTSLERLLYGCLETNGIEYLRQKRIGRFIADAYVPALRTVIEVDGEYWHSLPVNQARDRKKDSVVAALGLRMLRITEREARADIQAALERGGICL